MRAAARRLEFDLLRHLGREAERDGSFVPHSLELRFGEGEEMEHGPVEIGQGLLVSGRIDRVDTADGMALVIDYKSGKKVDSYKVASWESENRFQAALYMLAVEELLGRRAVGGVYVALGAEDPRPRGMLAAGRGRARLGLGGQRPRASGGVRREARLGARADRRHRGRDPPRASSTSTPDSCAYRGRLLLPVDLPVRAVSLTPEQQQAVDRRDGSLLVRAGAGTGKTTVLVERFVRAVVDDEVPVEGMLAITFTDKAAAEMRERVRARFLELGRREDAPVGGGRRRSPRSTASARGCSAPTPSRPGIDPDYHVLDGLEAERVAVDAFDLALEDFLGPAARRGGPRPGRPGPARAGGLLHARRAPRHGAHRLLAPAQPRRAPPQPGSGCAPQPRG